MKKLLSLLIALSLLCSCAIGEQSGTKEDASQELLAIATEMAEKLGGLCASGYVQMTTNNPEIVALVQSWGRSLTGSPAPIRSKVHFADKDLLSSVKDVAGTYLPGTEAYSDFIVRSFLNSIPNQLAARQGLTAIAATAIARYSEVRLVDGVQPGMGLAVLDYGEALPMVFVSFWIVEGGAAEISASFADAGAIGELLINFDLDSTFEEMLTYLQQHPELEEELGELAEIIDAMLGQP